jgi:hypothetical protein
LEIPTRTSAKESVTNIPNLANAVNNSKTPIRVNTTRLEQNKRRAHEPSDLIDAEGLNEVVPF